MAETTEVDEWTAALRGECDQLHFAWLDERWLGMLHLRERKLAWGLRVVKLYQRRPGYNDVLGLDHVDFLVPNGVDGASVLRAEPDLRWAEEQGDYARWISLRFEGGPRSQAARSRPNNTGCYHC